MLAVGLLEVSTDTKVQLNLLEQQLFIPEFPKISLATYYKTLRESAQIHDLMAGAISVKMLAKNAVVEYKAIISKVIWDSVK